MEFFNNGYGKVLRIDGGIIHFENGQLIVDHGVFYPLKNGSLKKGFICTHHGYRVFLDLNGVAGIGVMEDSPNGKILVDRFTSVTAAKNYINELKGLDPECAVASLKDIHGFTLTDPASLQFRCDYQTSPTSYLFKQFNDAAYPELFKSFETLSLHNKLAVFLNNKYWAIADIDLNDYLMTERKEYLDAYYTPPEVDHYLYRNEYETNAIVAECIFETDILDYIE